MILLSCAKLPKSPYYLLRKEYHVSEKHLAPTYSSDPAYNDFGKVYSSLNILKTKQTMLTKGINSIQTIAQSNGLMEFLKGESSNHKTLSLPSDLEELEVLL